MDDTENTVWELCNQIGAPPDGVYAAMIRNALRQCEADTIRRCSDMAGAIAEEARGTAPWGTYSGGGHMEQFARGASAASGAILSLLPKEPGQ